MVNTLVRNIVVKKLQGNIFTLANQKDYPTETIIVGFGQSFESTDYKHNYTKRSTKELAEYDKRFEGMELPF